MESDSVVLAAATAVVAAAQIGILATARSGGTRDRIYVVVAAAGAVVLCVLAWLELAG